MKKLSNKLRKGKKKIDENFDVKRLKDSTMATALNACKTGDWDQYERLMGDSKQGFSDEELYELFEHCTNALKSGKAKVYETDGGTIKDIRSFKNVILLSARESLGYFYDGYNLEGDEQVIVAWD